MSRWVRVAAGVAILAIVAAGVALAWRTRAEAHRLLTNPLDTRPLPGKRPIDYGLLYQDVAVTTSDGLRLVGWYVPPRNGALVLLQHGYKSHRGEMLNEAAMLARHGYGSLLTTVRGHDMSDGDLITFGSGEMRDLEAWHALAPTLSGVDVGRLGIIGNSFGGTLAIEFAADHPALAAVVANSAFSSLRDTVETSVRYFTGLPPFPFAPLITFWAEREAGFRTDDVDAKRWIGRLSPRPVLLMQGGRDVVISPESGRKLYEAAREPKTLWFAPDLGHTRFDTAAPEEYEQRVVGLFDRYLLGR
ncbi:MAG: alpha/beta hydrolase [Acidobacteria bacterium]|nr:alpha/beta hydrolase [Acidobacteriota bacterium]